MYIQKEAFENLVKKGIVKKRINPKTKQVEYALTDSAFLALQELWANGFSMKDAIQHLISKGN